MYSDVWFVVCLVVFFFPHKIGDWSVCKTSNTKHWLVWNFVTQIITPGLCSLAERSWEREKNPKFLIGWNSITIQHALKKQKTTSVKCTKKAVYENPTALTCISDSVGIWNICVFLRTAVLLGSAHPCEQGCRSAKLAGCRGHCGGTQKILFRS